MTGWLHTLVLVVVGFAIGWAAMWVSAPGAVLRLLFTVLAVYALGYWSGWNEGRGRRGV